MPNSVCLYIVCTYDSSKNELWSYVGEDCVVKMLHKLNAVSKRATREMRFNKKIHMTEEDTANFSSATKCYLCKNSLYNDNGEFKGVRDHDHKTGCYLGAACNKCNTNYYANRYLPVFFHNLSNYDSHFIIQKAYEISDELMEMKPMKYKKDDEDGKYKKGDYILDANGEKILEAVTPKISAIPNSYEKFISFYRRY